MTAAESHARFHAGRLALAAAARDALAAAAPALPPRFRRIERWAVTGTGASEGVARALTWLLQRHGRKDACFVPLSYFASAPGPAWDGLILVSQGLSPNARLALADRDRFDATVVITAAPDHPILARRSDALVLAHPPADESAMLVRVCGPAAAMTTAARFVDALVALDGQPSYFDLGPLPARLDALAAAAFPAVAGEVALVTEEATAAVAHALRWKWLETVASCDPPCWDVLQFAHGAWQYACDRRLTLVTLERDATALFDRLATMLDPARHTLLRLQSALPAPGCFIELGAMFDGVVDASLTAADRDLLDWPGKGRDGALYDLGG